MCTGWWLRRWFELDYCTRRSFINEVCLKEEEENLGFIEAGKPMGSYGIGEEDRAHSDLRICRGRVVLCAQSLPRTSRGDRLKLNIVSLSFYWRRLSFFFILSDYSDGLTKKRKEKNF